jgi:hypothetical protein
VVEGGRGEEMTQTMYAHVNKRIKKLKINYNMHISLTH